MKERLSPLKQTDIHNLATTYDILTFRNDFDLVYEDQVPTTGIILLDGQIDLIKDSKVCESLTPSCIIGVNQLLNEKPVHYGCRVKANSKIVLLGKSEILKSIKDQSCKFHRLLDELK